jgi:hypothetical protein
MDKMLYPTIAYLITSVRRSGPMLTKSFGAYDENPRTQHLCLWESQQDAEEVLRGLPDPEMWVVLEVIVSDSREDP